MSSSILSFLALLDTLDSSSSSSDSEDESFLISRPKVYKVRVTIFDKWSDDEFHMRFRLTKGLTVNLLYRIRGIIISRSKSGDAITPETKLLLTLRFFATGNISMSVSDFVGVSVASARIIVKEVSEVIASIRPNYVHMPKSSRDLNKVAHEFYNIASLPNCCGAIGYTHIKIISPGRKDAEAFRNRKGYFSLKVQTVSDANLNFINIVARWPGSVHDKTIFNNSLLKAQLQNEVYGNFRLIGHIGCTLQKYLFTPVKDPVNERQRLYNESLLRTHSVVERQHDVWKRRFPILTVGMRVNLKTAMAVIVATTVLHNMAIDINDPMPEEDTNEENIYRPGIDDAKKARNIFINEHFTS